ncbi:fosmidomycin resistance protein [Azorhizobium oxalatiphilum]|uniref:Fosmidomycin resistance protein n=1 Tax=Azorhizobium oxalatiphilum TaxID=980631 RepID=A0A917F899_9HYPH|nr:MFS transporter [Azorhizobium oxalatiphilum]GGF57338.1 fosmidomycin resistance protein [Azorhizobium oxalatiphilum]
MSQSVLDRPQASATVFPVLGAVSFCHMLNDMMQSLLLAIYPVLKGGFHLDFGQIGLLTFTYQAMASLLQPLVGLYTDRRPQPFSLPVAMSFSASGLLTLAFATSFPQLIIGAALLGTGSSIFHPEAARLAHLASGGAHGTAQSIFQVGGNLGTALGPLIAALLILPKGLAYLAWCGVPALAGIAVMAWLGHWYRSNGHARRPARKASVIHADLTKGQVGKALAVLIALIFSKYFYLSSINSFYLFYLTRRFDVSPEAAQLCLFAFLVSAAVGIAIGGPLGDRIGRRKVIWGSILGVLPFTLALPYVGLTATIVLSVLIGMILSSAFSAIVVYAQQLLPGRVGMVSGLFFGLAFGMAGLGAAVLGELADWTSIDVVYRVCSFLPLLGLLAIFLPDIEGMARKRST